MAHTAQHGENLRITYIADEIDRTPSILVSERNPDEVPRALEQSSSRVEVGDLGNIRIETCWVGSRVRFWEEAHGGRDDGNSRSCRQEIAPKHREADNDGDGLLVPLRPERVRR